MQELLGQVAIVTGAGRGIGRAIAIELGAAGAAVACAARTGGEVEETAAAIRSAGGVAAAFTADVIDRASVETMADAVEASLGPPDILVNNAGTHHGIGPIWEVDPGDWWRDIETSLLGVFLCSRAVLPGMLARGSGRIVNLSSGAATEPRPWSSGYTAAKTGAQRFTESVQLSLAGTGVRMFSLNPGPVLTPMNLRNRESPAWQKWYPAQRTMEYFPAEKAAGYVRVLCSGRADHLAGRFLSTFDDLEAVIAATADGIDEMTRTLRVSP
jgi:NAD(P)-dependent dehydrogenase (short-subunit alcohol dehydrogenase family)